MEINIWNGATFGKQYQSASTADDQPKKVSAPRMWSSGTMSTTVAETREDKGRRIGRENVDGVPLGRTATAAPMAPTPSLVEERLTKRRPAQNIGREIAEAATVS